MDHLRQRIQHHARQNDSLLNSQIEVEEETITIHGPIWKWNWVSKLRDGLLPAAFSKVHPVFKTPHIGTILVGIFVALGAGLAWW